MTAQTLTELALTAEQVLLAGASRDGGAIAPLCRCSDEDGVEIGTHWRMLLNRSTQGNQLLAISFFLKLLVFDPVDEVIVQWQK